MTALESLASRLADAEGLAARRGLGAVALIACTVTQALRTVSFFEPCLILVVEGHKRIRLPGLDASAPQGQGVLVRAGAQPDIGNHPRGLGGRYRAVVLTFDRTLRDAFRHQSQGPAAAADAPWHMVDTTQTGLGDAVAHAGAGLLDQTLPEAMARHRLLEVLLSLAAQGVGLPAEADAGAPEQVRLMIAAAPHRPWSAADAAQRLGVSEPTLRRHLAADGTSFRDLLAEVRLSLGLTLLQTSRRSVADVALACGYDSPSRFAARFKTRYGLSPSELRGSPDGA